MKAICVVPKFDEPTEYSSKWNEKLRTSIGGQGEFILLLMADAIRENAEESLKNNPDVMLIHYDHGNEDRLIGQDRRAVVDLVNVALLKDREVYNMNCLSAKTLGKAAYKDGCRAYWGYIREVAFTTDVEEDFCEAFNYGLLLRVQGKSWKECLELTKEKMTQIIEDLVKRGNVIGAMCLVQDRDALRCWEKDTEIPTEPCPVSRAIANLFGYRVLTKLRRFRDKLKAVG